MTTIIQNLSDLVDFYIKRVIYLTKKFTYNLFGWKMDFPNIDEIPPDIFIKSVLAASHEAYNRDRKEIKHTKTMKLVLDVAEQCNYNRLSHGYYKHGHYSFRVFDLMNTTFTFHSLHGLKKDRTINIDLVEYCIPIISGLKGHFLSNFNVFMKKEHTEGVPDEYVEFYKNADSFERSVTSLTKKNKKDLPAIYDKFKDKISDFDIQLKGIPKDNLEFYFKFSDLIEGLLIVSKYRKSFSAIIMKNTIADLSDLYKENISFLLFPYLETLSGGDIDYETQRYNTTIANKKRYSIRRFDEIEAGIIRYGLKPTINELDEEFKVQLSKMNENDKENLTKLITFSE